MEELRSVARTETILGQEIKVGELLADSRVPVSLGLGAGGGQGSDNKKTGEGGGGGGGVVVTPIAFIVSKGEDISFHALKPGGSWTASLNSCPGRRKNYGQGPGS